MLSQQTADAINDLQATLGRLDGKPSVQIYLGPDGWSSVFLCRDAAPDMVSISVGGQGGIDAHIAEAHAAVRAGEWREPPAPPTAAPAQAEEIEAA